MRRLVEKSEGVEAREEVEIAGCRVDCSTSAVDCNPFLKMCLNVF